MLKAGTASFKGPVFAAHGGRDQFASMEQVEAMLQEFSMLSRGNSPVLIKYPDCDHFFEGNQQAVAREIFDWMAGSNFAGLQSN